MKIATSLTLLVFLALSSCNNSKRLPVLGIKTAITKTENGKEVTDSLDYTIPQFSFLDQDGNVVDSTVLKNKIFVAEFFFTSCPSICPKMQAQMLRVNEKYKSDSNVLILAYTIDPARDTVAKLHEYAQKLGVESSKWHFLTGNKDSIYSLATSYLVSAAEDPDAPGGHIHSGNFILVDMQRRIRGYYDGTNEKGVEKLLGDIDILQKEENNENLQTTSIK